MVSSRGGVEDTRLAANVKDTIKIRGQDQEHKKNPGPRPRIAIPRTDPPEAKDRNAQGQGQRTRTQAQVFLKNFFSGDLHKKKGHQK